MTDITWHSAKVKLADLKDFPDNPRKMSKEDFNKLVKSLKEDGYHQRLLVNVDNVIIGGHQRKKAMLKAGFTEDDEIEVLKPNRLLEGDDFDRINIRDNLPFGAFDFDMLGNLWEPEKLIAWGMPSEWLGMSIGDPPPDKEEKEPKSRVKECPNCGEIL